MFLAFLVGGVSGGKLSLIKKNSVDFTNNSCDSIHRASGMEFSSLKLEKRPYR